MWQQKTVNWKIIQRIKRKDVEILLNRVKHWNWCFIPVTRKKKQTKEAKDFVCKFLTSLLL